MRLAVKELSETEYRNKITYVSYACAPIFYILLKNRKVPVGLLTVIVLIVLAFCMVWMPLFDYIVAPVCTLVIIYIAAYVLKTYCQPVWKVVAGECR